MFQFSGHPVHSQHQPRRTQGMPRASSAAAGRSQSSIQPLSSKHAHPPTTTTLHWAAWPLSTPPLSCSGTSGRSEGGTMDQLQVVAEARPTAFVGTHRLEDAAVGTACTWRNILMGFYRSVPSTLHAAPPLSSPALPVSSDRVHPGFSPAKPA